jgi:hypothetical protein
MERLIDNKRFDWEELLIAAREDDEDAYIIELAAPIIHFIENGLYGRWRQP